MLFKNFDVIPDLSKLNPAVFSFLTRKLLQENRNRFLSISLPVESDLVHLAFSFPPYYDNYEVIICQYEATCLRTDPEAVGRAVYDAAEQYLLRTLNDAVK